MTKLDGCFSPCQFSRSRARVPERRFSRILQECSKSHYDVINSLNLAAPPEFRGLDPNKPIRKYIRYLPHWRQDGAYYAATFRLADSLPKAKLDMLKSMRREWEAKFPEPRSEEAWKIYARSVAERVDEWLDQGAGECHFKVGAFANELARSILHFQHEQYHVASYVVMPNHCHLIMKPFGEYELEDLLAQSKVLPHAL